MSETIAITVTYRDPITFHLRIIGMNDESKLRQKMFGLTEDEQAEKSYQNNVDMLADLSEAMPTVRRLVKEEKEGKQIESVQEVALTEAKTFPSGIVREYFKERTVIKERIAEYAVRGYFIKIQPDVSFS